MNLVKHYNDLTEINGLRYSDLSGADSLRRSLAAMEAKIETRIAFTDVKLCYQDTIDLMNNAGWTIARKTRDWHRSHDGDYELNLFYKIFPKNKSDLTDLRKRQPATYPCHRSLSGSCSMGLIDNLDKDWLVAPKYPERYLTLIRLQRTPTLAEQAKMKYYRFEPVFMSDVAQYYANGWKPEDYFKGSRWDKEQAFWASKDAPKKEGFIP